MLSVFEMPSGSLQLILCHEPKGIAMEDVSDLFYPPSKPRNSSVLAGVRSASYLSDKAAKLEMNFFGLREEYSLQFST